MGNARGRYNAISLSRAFILDFQLHFVCKVIKEAPRQTLHTEMNNSFFYTDSEMNAQRMWIHALKTTSHCQRLQVHGVEKVVHWLLYSENSQVRQQPFAPCCIYFVFYFNSVALTVWVIRVWRCRTIGQRFPRL